MNQDFLRSLFLLSQRYYRHALHETAADLLQFLLRHAPGCAEYHYALGKALHAQLAHDGAIRSYRRALKLGLADMTVYLYIGQCRIFQGHFDEAAEDLRRFLALAQTQPDSSSLSRQVQMADHLLNQLVLPRLACAANPRVSTNPAAAAVQPGGNPGGRPMEMAR